MERVARCLCGASTIKVQGDPKFTAVCSCTNCQRRTGSAFGMSAYFPDSAILETKGTWREYHEKNESGNKITSTFCERCGSTVYWKAQFIQDHTGVAVGCFTDPEFPEPTVAVWNRSKFHWVTFPDHWHCMEKQEPKNT